MRQEIIGLHVNDAMGNPAGGHTSGTGIDIEWQNGPLGRGSERMEPNGAFVEGVIEAARNRIQWYQDTLDGKFSCSENNQAIYHLGQALEHLDQRTRGREERKVEGTHTA